MDEDTANTNRLIFDGLNDYNMIHAKVPNVKKKRKFENEQLYIPLSKHTCGYRGSGCEHEQPLANESDEKEMTKGKRAAKLSDDNPQHSFVYGNADDENTLETKYPPQTSTCAQSLGSCSNNDLKDSLHSPDRRSITELNNFSKEEREIVTGVTESNLRNDKGQLQIEEGAQLSVDSKQLEEGFHCCLDEELEYMMVYSNGPSVTNPFVPQSERWIINQEERPGLKGPTIDQEFEQYFSTLLL